MFYYYIDNGVYSSEIELNEANGYGKDANGNDRAKPITLEQYEFGLANKGATYSEVLAMQMTPADPFELAKIAKQNELNVWAYTFVSNGYEDTETGYNLFCSEADVSNYATLKNAIMDMADSKEVEFGTMTGWQVSTKGVVYPLLVRYSAYMLPFTTKYMKLTSYLQYATTVEEINQIII